MASAHSAAWTASSAISASLRRATGTPNRTTTESPAYCLTTPPCAATCRAIASMYSLSHSMTTSAPCFSDAVVNPVRSVKRAVTVSRCERGRLPSRNSSRRRQIVSATSLETWREKSCITMPRCTVS